ncbi:receptor-type tyrosine-protein phosphatase delta-like [Plakobranchus ocellatus]|uniref:protein-tyrosine-phosphatase n=1 Tax=Plakobranchus ocellatus TaxID=259542 RepID=A0AAV4DII4_9GAST|nr:receptor-type tyrosine-protein phosphatase delta-like [Plakobranchus ocellatus]
MRPRRGEVGISLDSFTSALDEGRLVDGEPVRVNLMATKVEASQNETRKVEQSVELKCPSLAADQEFQSLDWFRQDVIVATMKKDGSQEILDLSTSTRMVITDERHLKITDLEVGDSAQYRCRVIYLKQGSLNVEDIEMNHTLIVQDKPGPPGKPELSNVQPRAVTVSWAPSSEINNSPVTKYILTTSECQARTSKTVEVPVSNADTGGVLKYDVEGLFPYTCYNIIATAVNSVGSSQRSQPSVEFYTESEAEDNHTTTVQMLNDSPAKAPYNFKATPVNSTEILLEWEPPPDSAINGDLEGYIISYGTDRDDLESFTIDDPDQKEARIQGLIPYTLYMIKIKAKNSAGSGPEAARDVLTKEGKPSKPRITHVSDQQATSFVVHWEPPTQLNGQLIEYQLKWTLDSESTPRHISGYLVNNPQTAKIDKLTPYTSYKVQVAAVTNGGQGPFSEEYPVLTDVMAPSRPLNLNVTQRSSTSVHLHWESPTHVFRRVDFYLIKGWNNRGDSVLKRVDHGTQYILSGLTRNSHYFVKVCGITKSLFSHEQWKGDYSTLVNFTLGVPSGSDIVIWDRNYEPQQSRRDSGMHAGVIILIVLIVCLVFATAGLLIGYRFYTCRKCYQDTYRYFVVPSNGMPVQQPILPVEDISEEKQYPDISVVDFLPHVEHMHSDSDIGFSQEFDEINRSSQSDKYSYDNSNLAENKNKNRYINIVAYDHSRVTMKTELGRLRQTDYINANYVDGYTKPKAYIATQGPLPQTFSDFWRMVWEQNTNVIVMITNLMEKGRRKCDQYWPNDGQEMYGNMQVKLITTVPRAHYTVRIFSLRNMKRHSMKGSAERTVYHYHYTEWPDHGVPDYSLPVLSFVQKSAAQSGPENGPIVVHCSAGVGRTGTYILIDSMIAQIEDKQSINIPGFTQHIRRQRNFLVQTEDQYIFIHEVLKEYLLANGVTEVREDQIGEHLKKLEQPLESLILTSFTQSSMLERQYQLVTEYTPNEMDLSAALKPVNQEKNRVGSILPVNMKRVMLPARPGVDGSDYINATFLQGYKKSSEFIVTQHPTEDTMEDFWRMVWDKNSPVIVVLSSFDDLEYKEFWPPKGSSIEVDSGNFRLVMKDESSTEDLQEKGISILEFILDSIQYDYTLMTRIICLKSWPASCSELHAVFDPIILAHSYINSLECGPVVVMDRFGGVEAGTFCALWTLRDQMLSEKCCDFYEVCKLYHYKRPGIVGTQDDYLFLHRAMAALCLNLQEEHSSNGASPRHHHHYHFPSFHSGSSSRQNGTLPRSSPNNANPPPCNNSTPNNIVSGSHTLPRASTNTARRSTTSGGGAGAGDGSNSAVTTPTAPSAAVEETNI